MDPFKAVEKFAGSEAAIYLQLQSGVDSELATNCQALGELKMARFNPLNWIKWIFRTGPLRDYSKKVADLRGKIEALKQPYLEEMGKGSAASAAVLIGNEFPTADNIQGYKADITNKIDTAKGLGPIQDAKGEVIAFLQGVLEADPSAYQRAVGEGLVDQLIDEVNKAAKLTSGVWNDNKGRVAIDITKKMDNVYKCLSEENQEKKRIDIGGKIVSVRFIIGSSS